jgi:hypothetical protein
VWLLWLRFSLSFSSGKFQDSRFTCNEVTVASFQILISLFMFKKVSLSNLGINLSELLKMFFLKCIPAICIHSSGDSWCCYIVAHYKWSHFL